MQFSFASAAAALRGTAPAGSKSARSSNARGVGAVRGGSISKSAHDVVQVATLVFLLGRVCSGAVLVALMMTPPGGRRYAWLCGEAAGRGGKQ